MINRELIRIKAVQLTYAYFQNSDNNIEKAEKEFMFSLAKAYHLYNYLLQLIVEVTQMAQKHYDFALARAEREGEELPSAKFVNNRFVISLSNNNMLRAFKEEQKAIWTDNIEYVKKLYTQIEQSNIYKEYMQAEDDSFEADREIWRKIYRQIIQNNEDLDAMLEEISIYWNDDKEVVDTFVLKTIKRFDEKSTEDLELLPDFSDQEDRLFASKLFRSSILNSEQYQQYMSEASRNWDFSRLAYMDVIIMQLAIAEMVTFPNIPVNVTINEYVDLAKIYSTPRSAGYINGMLDAIARHLIATGKMLKTMPERK